MQGQFSFDVKVESLCRDEGKRQRHKLKHQAELSYCEGNWALEWVAHRGCGISPTGNI